MDKELVLALLKLTPQWHRLLDEFPKETVVESLAILDTEDNGLPAVWIGIEDVTLMLYPGMQWVKVYVPQSADFERSYLAVSKDHFPVQPVTFKNRATHAYMRVREGWTKDYAVLFEKMMRVPMDERSDPKHAEMLEYLIENCDPELEQAFALYLNVNFDAKRAGNDFYPPPTLH